MASTRVHQDLHNFERKRKGFTTRQWGSVASAAAAAVAVGALCVYALRLAVEASFIPIVAAVAPFAVIGFFPVQRMPADKYFERLSDVNDRGDGLIWHGDATPIRESRLSREYIRKSKKPNFECQSSPLLEARRAAVEAGNVDEEGRPLPWRT